MSEDPTIAFNVLSNSPLHHSTFPVPGENDWEYDMPFNTVLSGPGIYESIFEMSPIVQIWGFFG